MDAKLVIKAHYVESPVTAAARLFLEVRTTQNETHGNKHVSVTRSIE